MRLFSSIILALVTTLTRAHYNFERLIVNGQTTGPYEYVRALGPMVGNGPFYDVKHSDIRCNNGSFAAASKTKTYPVKAGDTVGFTVRDVLGHPGPLFAYMSKSTVANVSAYQGEGDWFKIYEMGVKTYANYSLAMTWLSDGWTKFDFKIPKDIENGQYLLRAEHIAVHAAGGPDGAGAQFYIGCAQIEVSGATGKKPSPVGKFPDSSRDPGIYFSPYWPPIVNYTMPGLKVYPEGGSFPAFTADPAKPVATQPLPASFAGAKPTAAAFVA
ncbi:hypothetical protein SLS61_003507 [Didymella pomorum]